MDLAVFSRSYSEARHKFLEAAAHCGAHVEEWAHPLKGPAGESLAASDGFQALRVRHAAMLAAYRAQRWEEAAALSVAADADARALGLALEDFYGLYQERLQQYTQTPPQPGWDGVYEAKTK